MVGREGGRLRMSRIRCTRTLCMCLFEKAPEHPGGGGLIKMRDSFASVTVEYNKHFVEDGRVLTSAAISAGIDTWNAPIRQAMLAESRSEPSHRTPAKGRRVVFRVPKGGHWSSTVKGDLT
jgi:hypothetical protein